MLLAACDLQGVSPILLNALFTDMLPIGIEEVSCPNWYQIRYPTRTRAPSKVSVQRRSGEVK